MSDARDRGPAGRGRRQARSCSGIDLDGAQRRGARGDGPERRRQVHAVARASWASRATRCSAARSPSTASTCWRSPPWQRAQAGLFLAMQYPTEVPGVSLDAMLTEALRGRRAVDVDGLRRPRRGRGRADRLRRSASSSGRSTSTCPAARRSATRRCSSRCSQPAIAILDELDSGLDIDALRACARRIEAATHDDEPRRAGDHALQPAAARAPARHVHILVKGRIVRSGGAALAAELEAEGYAPDLD